MGAGEAVVEREGALDRGGVSEWAGEAVGEAGVSRE